MAKTGYVVSNGYVNINKMRELADRFKALFLKHCCDVEVVSTAEIYPIIQNNGSIEIKGLSRSDFILFWDKDVLLAQVLEKAGHKLYNSSKAIQICDNKIYTHNYLSGHNIKMPKTLPMPLVFEGSPYYNETFINNAEKEIGYPMIIKEAYGSFGQQVYLCYDRRQVDALVKKLKYKPYLFQQFISESKGRDIRIFVVGGKVVASMLRENDNDFRANISIGGKMTAITPPKEYMDVAVKAANIIGLDYCGVDLLIGSGGPLLCEVNSNAHFKNIQICSGIDVAEHFVKYIIGDAV
jgi:gamma-F420-2:alpha-L-glutamate ligase